MDEYLRKLGYTGVGHGNSSLLTFSPEFGCRISTTDSMTAMLMAVWFLDFHYQ
jgi:hypothetical protein